MSASVRTHQVIQLSGFPISRRVTDLTGQPRFAFAKSHAPPSASSRRSVAKPALAYGFPSRWLSGEGFFQPSGSADMPGAQVKKAWGLSQRAALSRSWIASRFGPTFRMQRVKSLEVILSVYVRGRPFTSPNIFVPTAICLDRIARSGSMSVHQRYHVSDVAGHSESIPVIQQIDSSGVVKETSDDLGRIANTMPSTSTRLTGGTPNTFTD